MPRQWRNAVVGVGVVGEWHARLFPRVANASLVAVCDKLADQARARLEKYGLGNVPVFTDEREMMDKVEIDVVHVCTPSGNHLEPALAAMERGKYVICEKPLEVNLERIDRMIAAAKKHNVKLAGIFQNRWNEANRALKQAVDEGRFGKLAYAGCYTPWYRTDQYYRDGGWRGTYKLDGGGAIMNQSVHAIDLLQWIMGPVETVSAYASSRIHPEIEVEDTLVCALTFNSGAHGVIMGSTAMFPGSEVRIEIGGENGTAIAENKLKFYKFREEREGDAELLERLGGRSTSTGGGASPTDVAMDLHHQNIDEILKAWDRGEEALTHGGEARKAIAIIMAMYESAKNGGVPVAVDQS